MFTKQKQKSSKTNPILRTLADSAYKLIANKAKACFFQRKSSHATSLMCNFNISPCGHSIAVQIF